MEAQYIRVSTVSQNTARQEVKKGNAFQFIDKCSGSIPFQERPAAKRLIARATNIKTVYVHSIDRLGRNTVDILNTIQLFTEKGICVISEKEGLRTLSKDGSENPISKMLVGILGTLAEFELSRIKERQLEGIAKAKAEGRYEDNGGARRKPEDTESFLSKPKIKAIARNLRQGKSLNDSRFIKVDGKPRIASKPTVIKVKRLLASL